MREVESGNRHIRGSLTEQSIFISCQEYLTIPLRDTWVAGIFFLKSAEMTFRQRLSKNITNSLSKYGNKYL